MQPLGFLLGTWWRDLHLQEAGRKHCQERAVSSSSLFFKPSLHRLEGFPKVQSGGKAAQLEPDRLCYPDKIVISRSSLKNSLSFF